MMRAKFGQQIGHLLAAAAILLGLVGGTATAAEPVKIGAIQVLTGPNSRYGIAIRNGLDLAVAEINAKGGVLGGRKIELVIEDSAGNKEQAINVVRKLIGRDRVPLIIGPTLSNEMFAIGPVANDRKIPIIGTSTTARGITEIGDYVFRTAMPEAAVIPVTLKAAQSKFGIKRVAVLYGNDDAFTKSAFDIFKENLERMGIEILTIESFGSKDTDFSAQLTKIKALNPDAVIVSALVEAASGILLQARQLGFAKSVTFIGGNGLNSAKLGEIAGAAADGTLVGSPWFIEKPDPLNQAFVAAYRKAYPGVEPDQFAAQAYDTAMIVAAAINRAGAPESEKLRAALLETKQTGVMGPFAFAPSRDPALSEGVVVLVMKSGVFSILP